MTISWIQVLLFIEKTQIQNNKQVATALLEVQSYLKHQQLYHVIRYHVIELAKDRSPVAMA